MLTYQKKTILNRHFAIKKPSAREGWRQKSPKVLGDFNDRRQFVNLRLCESKRSKCYKRSDRSELVNEMNLRARTNLGSNTAGHKKPSAREGFFMAHSAGFELTTF